MKKRYKAALFLPAAAATYFLAAWTLSSFRVNDRQSGGEITLFLVSNGTHVDVVMPLKNNVFDWTQTVSPADSGLGGSGTEYIGLGWGERNFYLNTPSWGDLTVPTALRALSGFNRTLIHATYYPSEPAENENTVRFSASPNTGGWPKRCATVSGCKTAARWPSPVRITTRTTRFMKPKAATTFSIPAIPG